MRTASDHQTGALRAPSVLTPRNGNRKACPLGVGLRGLGAHPPVVRAPLAPAPPAPAALVPVLAHVALRPPQDSYGRRRAAPLSNHPRERALRGDPAGATSRCRPPRSAGGWLERRLEPDHARRARLAFDRGAFLPHRARSRLVARDAVCRQLLVAGARGLCSVRTFVWSTFASRNDFHWLRIHAPSHELRAASVERALHNLLIRPDVGEIVHSPDERLISD